MTVRPTGIANVAPEDLMTDASSTATVAELASALEEHGLFWPPAALVAPERSLGDVLSRAPGGHTRLGAAIRRYVLALDVELADGSTMRAGARTVKCVTGYDLKQLFIGSRGCLGTITGATLRLESEANRDAVERRLDEDFAGLEARRGSGPAGSARAGRNAQADHGWRDILGRLKAELDPNGLLPSIGEQWPSGDECGARAEDGAADASSSSEEA